jgi:hypothetical protein
MLTIIQSNLYENTGIYLGEQMQPIILLATLIFIYAMELKLRHPKRV